MKNTRIIFPLSKILLFSFLFLLITKCTTNFLNLEIILYVFKLSFFFRNENSSNKFSFLYLFLFCLNSSIIRLTNYNWKHITVRRVWHRSRRLWLCTIIKVRKINVNLRILRWTRHYRHTEFYKLFIIQFGRFLVSQPLKARKQRFRFNFFFFSLSLFFLI